jgi:hypothetical protein
MHQIAPQIRLTALPLEPARKIGLEERDFAHIATGILDSITKSFGRQCFRLIVHCPANNDLFLAMLVSRGFSFASRYCRSPILLLLRLTSSSSPSNSSQMSRSRPVGLTN